MSAVDQHSGSHAATGVALARSSTGAKRRSLFIDQLRAVLIALVIAHHAAICYTPLENSVPLNLNTAGPWLSAALMWFIAVNQAFFMGMFFLISGYFVPRSVARKGAGAFLRDRLLRLGIPLLVYWFLLVPVFYPLALATALDVSYPGAVKAFFSAPFSLESGPLWFLITLLAFSVGYVLWVRAFGKSFEDDPARAIPASWTWVLAALALGVVTFGVRVVFPLGQAIPGTEVLNTFGLGYFRTGVAYLPVYIFLFALGCVAARHRWLDRIEAPQAQFWGWIALAVIGLYAYVVMQFTFSVQGDPEAASASLAELGLVVAFGDQFIAFGVIAWLLWWFRAHEGWGGEFLARAGANAFGAFILHQPILIVLEVLTKDLPLPVFVIFLAVTVAAIFLAFTATALLRRSALVRRVL
jgi:fucose 4-O-acetylase-like acetyltransferase